MTMQSVIASNAVKLGLRHSAPALKHIQRHWAKYTTGGFVIDSIFSQGDKRQDIKNSDKDFTDDDAEFIVADVDGYLEDMQDGSIRMSDKIKRGDEIPHYLLINLDDGAGTLLSTYFGASASYRKDRLIRTLQRKLAAAYRRLNANQSAVIGRD